MSSTKLAFIAVACFGLGLLAPLFFLGYDRMSSDTPLEPKWRVIAAFGSSWVFCFLGFRVLRKAR